jgi:hypothetical protein
MGFCGGGERTIVGRIALEGPRGRRPQVRMLSSAEFQNAKLVPAAGEAAGPPGPIRRMFVPSIMLRGIIGGPAAPPAAGTNAFERGISKRQIGTRGRRGRRPSRGST